MKIIIAFFLLQPLFVFSQTDTLFGKNDSLENVVVQGFASNKKWKDVPAAVAIIQHKQLTTINNTNLLPAINTVAGVKMEERSLGSYRLSIRGSTLRSPFGVRNIKVYYNNISLTDGGGNTYLNLLSLQQITEIEILKGASASLYGAGTGGAVLLKNELPFTEKRNNIFFYNLNAGSYALINQDAGWKSSGKKFSQQVLLTQQQCNGYRDQSYMLKDAVHWNASLKLKQQKFDAIVFYTDLFYQTPGGLTLAQMNTNPQAARLATATLPGAVQQKASIRNRTVFTGFNHQFNINQHWFTETAISFNYTNFINPFITNYEERRETNFSVRSNIIYKQKNWQWVSGAEWLNNHSQINDYGNNNGVKDTVQFKDNVYANQWFAFTQLQYTFNKFLIQTGLSINQQQYRYRRLTDVNQTNYSQANSNIVAAPRLAINYQLAKNISLYSLVAKGFSPPSLAEVNPSDKLFHAELQPEYGWNYEAGIKGYLFNHHLLFDVAAYYFELHNTIVGRNNSAGNQYFVNAGDAVEKGIESSLQYQHKCKQKTWLQSFHFFSSYSFQPYYFSSYIQGSNNYSGNAVTGVSKNIFVVGGVLQFVHQFSFNFSLNNTSSLPLNDANDEFAKAYHLLQAKLAKGFSLQKIKGEVYCVGDNLLNEHYSLGNDINAAGRRYYNPSATVNFNMGMKIVF